MNDEQEIESAIDVLAEARHFATMYCPLGSAPDEREAATVAILMRAFELATQNLSVERRNQLLKGELE